MKLNDKIAEKEERKEGGESMTKENLMRWIMRKNSKGSKRERPREEGKGGKGREEREGGVREGKGR